MDNITIYWKIIRGKRCKLKCSYCRNLAGKVPKEEKNKNSYRKVIPTLNYLSELYNIELVYYGGDNENKIKLPYLYKDIINNNINQTIYTTIFDINTFLKYNFNKRVNLILSFHYEYNQPEEFLNQIKLLETIYNIKEIIVPVSYNFDHLDKLTNLIAKNYKVKYVPILFNGNDVKNIDKVKDYSYEDYIYWKKEFNHSVKTCKITGLFIYNNKVYYCLHRKSIMKDVYIDIENKDEIKNIINKQIICNIKNCKVDYFEKRYIGHEY